MIKDDIKSLIKILEDSSIDELEISTFWGKRNIRISKHSQKQNHTHSEIEKSSNISNFNNSEIISKKEEINKKDIKSDYNKLEEPESFNETNEEIDTNNSSIVTIKAPLVGTFYLSPKPDEPPFIKIGDYIKKGQTFCIIEAMKIFNEIESEYSGKVIDILVNNSTPIEYDQDLIIISTE